MAIPSDAVIKNAIGDVIQSALTDLYSGTNPPVVVTVHRRWVLSHKIGESAALLRAKSGRDAGKVHAWMIGLSEIKRLRPLMGGDPVGMATKGSLRQQGPNKRDIIKSYRVWAFLQYDLNTLGVTDDLNNSENALAAEIEHVAKFFSRYPTLNLTDNEVQGHTELNFEGIDTYPLGETMTNLARGQLDLILYDSFQ